MNLLALATLTGIMLPPIIALVQQQKWGTRTKTIVTLILVSGAAVGALYGRGDWHGWTRQTLDLFAPILAGLVIGTWGSYAHLWQNLGVTQFIERATSFTGTAVSIFDELPPDQRAALEAEAFGLLKAAANPPTPAPAPPSA
jgi:hypothetical protein